MSCYHPLHGFVIGKTDSGKDKYKVCSQDVIGVAFDPGKKAVVGTFTKDSEIFWKNFRDPTVKIIRDYVELPCRQCIGCRLDYSRRWADRMMLELQYHSSSYFVTLTYDNWHVPVGSYLDPSSGELVYLSGDDQVEWSDRSKYLKKELLNPDRTQWDTVIFPTLRLRDFQLFMKSLRKDYGLSHENSLRYFASGEYGDKTFRPHFHIILFGLDLSDEQKVFWKMDRKNKFKYYKSPYLRDIWDCRGDVIVAEVNWNTCAYTSRYVAKKLLGAERHWYDDFNLEPPRSTMSRKPGLARQYYLDHPDCFVYSNINISTEDGGREIPIPKVFDRYLENDDSDFYEARRSFKRMIAENLKEMKLAGTSKSWKDYLITEEKKKLDYYKKLKGVTKL